MSDDLATVRCRLRDAVRSAGLSAFATVPERVTPPVAFVGPGDPYVSTEGANFGSEIVRCEVVVVASPGVNDRTANELDSLILTAFDAAAAAQFAITDVQRPGQITLGGQKYVAAVINVWTEIHREAS